LFGVTTMVRVVVVRFAPPSVAAMLRPTRMAFFGLPPPAATA
jgi:hypothetical protein